MDNTLSKWLDAILAISGDKMLTTQQLSERIGTSPRNVYNILKALKAYGFIVHRIHGFYNLDGKSPFFKEISTSVNFTNEQADFLYNLLDGLDKNDPMAGILKRKLTRFYQLDNQTHTIKTSDEQKKLFLLQKAVYRKQMVILHDYSSSHSQTVSDRTVEPFLFLGDNSDVRAYEPDSGCNKTFKISRIGRVEILKREWTYEARHKKVFTDMFLYTSEEWHHVRLRFDLAAHNFMLEEYPHSETLMRQEDETHWIYEADLAGYAGIGRFILGLYGNIDVFEDEGLRKYLECKVKEMHAVLKKH